MKSFRLFSGFYCLEFAQWAFAQTRTEVWPRYACPHNLLNNPSQGGFFCWQPPANVLALNSWCFRPIQRFDLDFCDLEERSCVR